MHSHGGRSSASRCTLTPAICSPLLQVGVALYEDKAMVLTEFMVRRRPAGAESQQSSYKETILARGIEAAGIYLRAERAWYFIHCACRRGATCFPCSTSRTSPGSECSRGAWGGGLRKSSISTIAGPPAAPVSCPVHPAACLHGTLANSLPFLSVAPAGTDAASAWLSMWHLPSRTLPFPAG